MKSNQKGNFGILAVFTTALLIALTGASVYFWQNYEKEKAINLAKNEKVVVPQSSDSQTTVIVEAPIPGEEPKFPVTVYTPDGLFTAEEKSEIQAKFINPFIDWNKEISQTTVSIEVEKPTPEIAGYRYKVSYINEGGVNGGFLYGASTPLEWWLPECMGGCNFSDEFKAKYPEIVAQVE